MVSGRVERLEKKTGDGVLRCEFVNLLKGSGHDHSVCGLRSPYTRIMDLQTLPG